MRPFEQEANRIVRHILENDPPLTRACSQCEVDHGIMNRSDPTKSHGYCKRHMIEWAREGGLSEQRIQQLIAATEAGNGWCPDLGPVGNKPQFQQAP